ncbi:glycosyl hydrolase family 28-related protein [Paracoccus pacificus]|uniref:Glycosyl hydrolase family 28-related protein n=1 Tax=Paracoccus pacificus TaxID=1463598 RepID=A0ABW4R5R0_9RHOB
MNIAITQGVALMPPRFSAGLATWSRSDGTPSSPNWANVSTAAVVPADQDFGTCLELTKTEDLCRIRYKGNTPIRPGVYLRISARIKAIAGPLASVRVGSWAGTNAGARVGGLAETGAMTPLPGYGEVVEVSAIVGAGNRGGVDLVWGTAPDIGHFGIDLLGANGGTVRIESIRIEDVTDAFLRDMMDWVDVRDFGAKGNGVSDDREAFAAADAAARGRSIVVPAGVYAINADLTIQSPIRFEGKLKMPVAARLALMKNFDFPTYEAAFGNDTEALKKGVQALLGYTDHNVFDLGGRQITLTEPINLRAVAPDLSTYVNRRMIANGQINVVAGAAWNTTAVNSTATYSKAQPTLLTRVVNAAAIEPGSLVTGAGVGREIYVSSVDVAGQKLVLSQPLYGEAGSRNFGFTRFRYAFDFSGMSKVERFGFDNVEFLLNGIASGWLLPPGGQENFMRDCHVNKPRDRGISSPGQGCQDLVVDRCQFMSNEMAELAQNRSSIAINVNANDAKIRSSRFIRFRHFLVAGGNGHLIVGNHWFQGDEATNAVRVAGVVFTEVNPRAALTGNYIDNSTIEWTNEHVAEPDLGTGFSFSGLTITGNHFVAINVAPWFRWFSIKPYGNGHFIQGLTVTSNVFRALNSTVDRIERVDTTFADLNYGRMRNIDFSGNVFNGVTQFVSNPVRYTHVQSTAQPVWVVNASDFLPFGGWARNVDAIVADGAVTNASGGRVTEMPFVTTEQGSQKKEIRINYSQAAKGRMNVLLRMDTAN